MRIHHYSTSSRICTHLISFSHTLNLTRTHTYMLVHLTHTPYTYTLQHTATHCNTRQHIATHCNTLQHAATHCNTLQHVHTLHIHTFLQHITTHCNTLQHTATHYNPLQQEKCFTYHSVQILKILFKGFYPLKSDPPHNIMRY